jgi:SEC-C motif-containing protein
MNTKKTPQDLMRSRYEAFVNMDADYLAKTTTQKQSVDLRGYENIIWLKLDVLQAQGDEVEFKAYYRDGEVLEVLHERSKFVYVDGEWLYDSGVLFNTKIERNEPCPCQSGRKYKKCCA